MRINDVNAGRQSSSLLEGPLGLYLAPIAALIYPATLWAFHLSVDAFETGGSSPAAAVAAATSLALSFILPGLIVLVALQLAGIDEPPRSSRLLRRLSLFFSVSCSTWPAIRFRTA